MEIQEAIIEAKDKQKGISRKKWMPNGSTLIPTNTSACFICVNSNSKGKSAIVRWEPSAKDILAHDWMVMG